MSYPVYKLLRAVNRQYPNNGFINYVDVREDMYDTYKDQMIDEDLRDLINETIQEVYKDVAIDEVWSFPTVPGQNQYVLPEDCDLRDIQEVTRTFVGRGPVRPPFGAEDDVDPGVKWTYTVTFSVAVGEGTIDGEQEKKYGVEENDTLETIPTVTTSEWYTFKGWSLDGTTIIPNEVILQTPVTEDMTYIAICEEEVEEVKSIVFISLLEDLEINNGTTTPGVDGHKTIRVPLGDSAVIGTGLSLDLENNKIIVGEGIEYARISANVQFANLSPDYTDINNERYLNIYVRTGDISQNIARTVMDFESAKADGDGKIEQAVVSNVIVPVEQGTEIYANVTGVTDDVLKGGTSFKNILTVEGIKLPSTQA